MFLGTTSQCWPWSWVRRMQAVHRLKRYNRQSRLRDLNSAIQMFLCIEWEAVLTELLFWHQQANAAFYLFFTLLFTEWWEEQRLAIKCRVLLSLVISILGIYVKLFMKYVSAELCFSRRTRQQKQKLQRLCSCQSTWEDCVVQGLAGSNDAFTARLLVEICSGPVASEWHRHLLTAWMIRRGCFRILLYENPRATETY